MRNVIDWCKEEVAAVPDAYALLRCCQAFLKPLGVTDVSYVKTDLYGNSNIHTTYDKGWLNHYSENALHEIDPVVALGKKQSVLSCWSSDTDCLKNKEFFDLAASYGVPKQGAVLTFGTRTGQAVFSIASDGCTREWKQAFAAHQTVLNYTAMSYCVRASQLDSQTRLTPRERDVILWAARGKTSWETSQVLEIAEGTVNQYLRSAMSKLDATNRVQAVAKAVELGVLSERP